MDIFDFIDSKDVKEYLKQQNYEFTTPEKAWLIYQSKKKTMKERHAGWEELIVSTKDCAMPIRHNCRVNMSLHTYIKKYIALENKLVKSFYKPEGAIYQYVSFTPSYGGIEERYSSYSCYSTAKNAIEAFFENCGDYSKPCFSIEKQYIDKERAGYLILNKDLEPMSVYDGINETEEEQAIDGLGFSGMWFNFPVPFKKGDLVYDAKSVSKTPFIYLGKTPDDLTSESTKHWVEEEGDETDMVSFGYFANEKGHIYHDTGIFYMGLEYYTDELKPYEKSLLALSNFEKGEIDIPLLLAARDKISADFTALDKSPTEFTEEGLQLAGLR